MSARAALSGMVERLRESGTIGMTRKARELREAGRDVLVISGGEPDFDTPDHIKAAAVAAIAAGQTKYPPTEGTAALKAAVARKMRRSHGIEAMPDRILIGTGGKQVIFNAFLATLEPGDEAIIPRPSWVSYADVVEMLEARPVLIDTDRTSGFKITPEALEAAITPATRWLVLNSPANPTGAVYSAEELGALAAVLLRHPHVLIMSDEIYEYIVFPPARFASIAAIEPRLVERTLLVNGVSKGYCMTGWRIGYGIGPAWLIAAMAKLQGQETNGASSISQAAAAAALDGSHDFVDAHNLAYRRRRDLVVRRINQIEGLSCDPPEGAFYVFVDASGLIGRRTPGGTRLADDSDVAEYLLESRGVALVPGAGFGLSPYLRLCFAYDDAVLADACERIARAVADLD